MKQIFMTGRGEIVVETVPEPTGPLGPGFVRVAVAHSLISTGTDRALIESSGGGSFARKLGNNPSLFRKVYSLCLEQGLSATRNAILDKNVIVPDGAQIGVDVNVDRERYTVSPGGVVALGKGAIV